jgi:uncharacterized protein (TIGR03067 family)
MMRTLSLAAVALAAAAVVADDTKPTDVAAKLEGTYTIVSGEKNGMPIPDGEIAGAVVRFSKDRVTGTDKDTKEFFAASYTLDTATKPIRIKMKTETPKAGTETTGIIELTDTGLRICYALPDGTEPTEFKTKNKQQMFVLKKK